MSNGAVRPGRLMVLSLVMVFLLGVLVAQGVAQMGGKARSIDVIDEVERMVTANYVEKPDQAKLTKGAIDGMLEALDDPYAEYIPAEEAAEFEKAMTGSFSGIGCQVDTKDGYLYIVSPLEDSPAFNAGVLAGDKIVKVDGKSTQGKKVDECIKMITGPEGTTVHVDILRMGQEISLDITRAKIVSKSVRGYRRQNGNGHWDYLIDPANKIAYVRMSQFTPTSPSELREALNHAADEAKTDPEKLGGLILDLRNNPGGLMDAAIEIADMFLDEGRIMSTKGRDGGAFPEVVYKAEHSEHTPKYPIAILVNGNSASASEIVSGSLSENNRAVVIGTRTFGKGLVQSVSGLRRDQRASVKFTTQRYYLPSGRLIQRSDDSKVWGVDPTPGMFLPLTDAENLAGLLKRRDWDILRKDGASLPDGVEAAPALADQHWSDPAWIESTAKDKQLAGALRTMSAKVTGGDWLKLSDEENLHGQIALAELKKLEKGQTALLKALAASEKRIETLQTLASTGKGALTTPDLWADSVDLTGGLVEVRDKDGKVIADLKITGRDIERWLAYADIEAPPQPAKPTDAAAKPDKDAPSKDSAKADEHKP